MSALDRWLQEGWLRPVDHALADTLRRLRPDTREPVLLAAALASHALAFGHGQLPLARAAELFLEIDAERPPPVMPEIESWPEALALSPWVLSPGDALDSNAPLVFEHGQLYLRRYWRYEQSLAEALRTRSAAVPTLPVQAAWRDQRLAELFPLLASDPHDAQAVAASTLLDTRLLLLTGGPGTGKTTTVTRALVLAVEAARRAGLPSPRIALAAPTGKAAARLAESLRENLAALRDSGAVAEDVAACLPTQASTLHRLLGWRAGGQGFAHDASHPLRADWVVVDEASMVDLPLMAKLVAAVAPEAGLLLVGDPDQLPSVETGDVLAALCDPASVLPRVHLHRVHRQDAGLGVGALAERIRDGKVEAVLDSLQSGSAAGVQWLAGTDRGLPAAALSAALPAYRTVQQAANPADALERAKRFRLLTALRDGASGSQALNARIADALRPVGERDQRLFAGALLMVTANSPRHGLFNGDIGVAWPDEQGQLRVWFDAGDSDGPRAWLPAALPAHEFAFALTVHKSQGSEFGEVFLALPERGARVLSRELLYTGLTRCRRGVTLWASEAALREGLGRGAQRWSGLARRLR
jgi:exodeoxyribonuclease V alpha subunit